MLELSALQPWLIGYFVVAAAAMVLAVAAIVRAVADVRQARTASSRSPAAPRPPWSPGTPPDRAPCQSTGWWAGRRPEWVVVIK
jgi:hypothetical protein